MRGHVRPRLCFSPSIHSLGKEWLHLIKWGARATISGALFQLRQRGPSRKQGHRKRCREHQEHPGSTVCDTLLRTAANVGPCLWPKEGVTTPVHTNAECRLASTLSPNRWT